jgi:hypothetical protein
MREDVLAGTTVVSREAGAQDLMALNQGLQAGLQEVGKKSAAQTEGSGQIVGGAGWVELIKKPEALLGEGERQFCSPVGGGNGRKRLLGTVVQSRFEDRSQGRGRRGIKQGAEREINGEGGADAPQGLSSEQGMATELKEVVMNADAVALQDLGPDVHEHFLDRRARSNQVVWLLL